MAVRLPEAGDRSEKLFAARPSTARNRWSTRFVMAFSGLVLLALVLGDCRTEGKVSTIILQPAKADGVWRATYRLSEEAGYLRFQRPASFYREKAWEVATPGWKLARNGDDQTLVAEAGAKTDEVTVQFRVHTEMIPKEYEFFRSFSDGSVALYTGHLYVTPSDSEEAEATSDVIRRLELAPAAGERLIVQGEVHPGPTLWEDTNGDGTYVYFGMIEPLETDDVTGIIDPGAPRWLVERIDKMLPAAFALYSRRLGEKLPWKPMVLFSFDNSDVPGLSSGGGTLTGVLQMSAAGRGWLEESPAASEQLLHLIAHEAAHFWNSQLHPSATTADSWMHEGSADALARLVLRQQGEVDDKRLAQQRTGALNRCAQGLLEGPLSSSDRRGRFGNFYSCGEMIAVWSAAVLFGPTETERLFDVWRAVFDASDSEDGSYDRESYFAALRTLGAKENQIDALRGLLDRQLEDPSEALVHFMKLAGIEITRLERPPFAMRREQAGLALRHLMADACRGQFSFYSEDRWLRTTKIEGCEPWNRSLRVTAIEGQVLTTDGDLALESLGVPCRANRPVTLDLADGDPIQVPCTTPPAPQPAPLAFPRL